jgi:hypothetical protein
METPDSQAGSVEFHLAIASRLLVSKEKSEFIATARG